MYRIVRKAYTSLFPCHFNYGDKDLPSPYELTIKQPKNSRNCGDKSKKPAVKHGQLRFAYFRTFVLYLPVHLRTGDLSKDTATKIYSTALAALCIRFVGISTRAAPQSP